MTTNLLLVGVGGQGTITASKVLSHACLLAGWQVKKSEIHGMSQRGGSVETHVRLSPDGEIHSPTIPDGEVDVLIAFELLEALRGLPQLKPDGKVVADRREIVPLTVASGGGTYPENGVEQLRASGRQVLIVDASEEAVALGELRAANIVLLGAASPLLPLPTEALEEAIRHTVKPKAVEVNLRAFARGRELAGNKG
jgi:indolepyruvate ferredoxin oxidoreductase beta subunit